MRIILLLIILLCGCRGGSIHIEENNPTPEVTEESLRKEISSLKGKEAQLKELIRQKDAAAIETVRTYLTWFGLLISVGSVIVLALGMYYQLSIVKRIAIFCSVIGISLLVISKLLPYLDMATTAISVLTVFSLLSIAVYYGVKYLLKLNKTITAVYAFGDDVYDRLVELNTSIREQSVKAFTSDSDRAEYIHNMITLAENLHIELANLKSSHKESQLADGVHKTIQEARRAITSKSIV